MVAPNGARRSKADHEHLPILADELAATALACRNEGASAIHLHVRDRHGRHTLDADAYREAIGAIGAVCPDIIIQTTTEAAGLFTLRQQVDAVVALRPSFLSFAVGELMREGAPAARQFIAWAAKAGVAIQFIVYTPEEISEFAQHWRAGRWGRAAEAPRLLLVVGRYAKTQDSTVAELETLLDRLDAEGLRENSVWMCCAFGRGELECLERAIAAGGHARVGFENAIVDRDGRAAHDNAERVRHVAEIARRQTRPLAGPERARAILGVRASSPLL